MYTRTRDIFISHAWSYSARYNGIVGLLDNASYFTWRNYSVPKHDPLIDPNSPVGKNQLKTLLDEQIRQASCLIVVAGMFVNHKYWIQTEINIAIAYQKPIVSVRRRNQQRTPQYLQYISNELCNWNSKSITDAIKSIC